MSRIEHTLALIKPEGIPHEKKIIAYLKKEGFIILAKRVVHLTPEQVSDFYLDRYGRLDFPLLVASTSLAPVVALCLGRPGAVENLKVIVGPEDINEAKESAPASLNAQFGSLGCNLAAVHASADLEAARREIHFFFPNSYIEPVAEGLEFLEREVTPLLKEGLAEMAREKPTEPLLWLAGWLLRNNPHKPRTDEHLD